MPRKKKDPRTALITVTQEQLDAMVAEAVTKSSKYVSATAEPAPFALDATVNLPTGDIPKELIADKASLPPPESRQSTPAQPPARLWGQHLQPSPIQHLVPGIRAGLTDPRTGNPINQVGPTGGSISPPPSRNFR